MADTVMTTSPQPEFLRTVIAVAGAEHSAEQLLGVLADMHRRDAHVVVLDADPSNADAPLPGGFSVETQEASDHEERIAVILAAVEEQAAAGQEVHLVGFGLGASLCISAAARSRGAVSSLALISGWLRSDRLLQETIGFGAALWSQDPSAAQRYSSLMEHSPRFRRNLGVNYFPQTPVVPLADPRIARRLRAAYHLDVTEAEGVVCPTLIIAGIWDAKVPPHHAHELFGAIPGSALLEVDAGHGVLSERLGQVYNAHRRLICGKIPTRERLTPVHA